MKADNYFTFLRNNSGLTVAEIWSVSCFSWEQEHVKGTVLLHGQHSVKKDHTKLQYRERNLVLAVAMIQPYQITIALCG